MATGAQPKAANPFGFRRSLQRTCSARSIPRFLSGSRQRPHPFGYVGLRFIDAARSPRADRSYIVSTHRFYVSVWPAATPGYSRGFLPIDCERCRGAH